MDVEETVKEGNMKLEIVELYTVSCILITWRE